MNKIIKSGGKWRSLPRRVSPVLNLFQALAVIAVLAALILMLKHRSTAGNTAAKPFRRTIAVNEAVHPLAKLSKELDPAAFLRDNPGAAVSPKSIPDKELLKFELSPPQQPVPEIKLQKFSRIEVSQLPFAGDMNLKSVYHLPMATFPETAVVMYDEYGKEISRWQSRGGNSGGVTLFRVDGEGVLQHFSVITSCGNAELDKQALFNAQQLQLPRGLYTVYYPAAAEKNKEAK